MPTPPAPRPAATVALALLCLAARPPAPEGERAAQSSPGTQSAAAPATPAQRMVAALRRANQAAYDAQEAHMARARIIFGGGSDGNLCMDQVRQGRDTAIAQLEAPLEALLSPPPSGDECANAARLAEPLATLAYGGMQNTPGTEVIEGAFNAVTCQVFPVRLPAALQALVARERRRCPGALPAPPRELPCTVSVDHEVQLRDHETADPAGVQLDPYVLMQVLAEGTLRNGSERMYRVRLVRNGPEGWTFLPPSEVPAHCPRATH